MNELTIQENNEIIAHGFRLHKSGLEAIGNPTYDQWELCGKFIRQAEGAVHFWIGDWLNYGESKWGQMYSQAMEETGYSYDTLKQDKWIAGKIDLCDRSHNLGIAHAKEIASLPEEEKKFWAEELKKEAIPVRELKEKIKEKKKASLPKPVIPEGKFNVIYADPPWKYDFSETESREIENKYPTMELDEIKAMKVPSHDNSVLFLWATAPKLREALEVMQEWGFEYKTHMMWDKEKIGMGYWFRGQHELLLVGTKGVFSPPEENDRFSSVYREARTEHSKKPEYFYQMIEKMFPEQSYLELFARQKRESWTAWGNQL